MVNNAIQFNTFMTGTGTKKNLGLGPQIIGTRIKNTGTWNRTKSFESSDWNQYKKLWGPGEVPVPVLRL